MVQKQVAKTTHNKIPLFSQQAQSLSIGSIYRHYKGKTYRLLAVSRHSETLEEYVVYQGLYGDQDIWVRPLYLFEEVVSIDNKLQPRFTLIT